MYRSAGVALLLLGVVATAFSCRSAASVFLDIPETPKTEGPEPTRSASTTGTPLSAAERDTVRPGIERLSDVDSVVARLPRGADGAIDWVAALREGVIRPLDAAKPSGEPRPRAFGFDFYLGSFEAYFPHSTHVNWLECKTCHPSIYRKRGTSTSMKQINEGESCGRCHGKVAFSLNACERCHTGISMPEGRLEPRLGPTSVIARASAAADSSTNKNFPSAIFPHGVHRLRYTCAACHPDLFPTAPLEPGAITMKGMQAGKACGVCHNGGAAFGILECGKCHREPSGNPESG